MKTYINSFYNPKNNTSKKFYNADRDAVLYGGYEIHRVSVEEYHIVKDGVCIGMYAGLNGAKNSIDIGGIKRP